MPLIWLFVKVLGVERLVGWARRLVALGLLVFAAVVTWVVLSLVPQAKWWLITGIVLFLGVRILLALRARRSIEADAGERTIDGKIVPDMLAAAALNIPPKSPDGDYVLRGLPDYGKTLLKLNSGDFEYLPEPLEELPSPVEEPVVNRARAGVPRWVMVAGAALLVVFVAGAVLYQHQRQVEIQNARLRAMMMGEGSTPVPQDPTSPQPQTDAQRSAEAPPPDGNAIREAAKNPPHSASRETPMSEADIHKLTAEGDRVIRESEKAIADYEAKKAQRNASRPLEPPSGTWRDPNTGLVWLTRDNGEAAIESKDAARRYCESVTTGDRLGWRLPTTPELKDAFTSNQMYLYGTLRSHRHFEMLWTSSSTDGVVPVGSPEEVGGIDLQNMRNFLHAVCVHD